MVWPFGRKKNKKPGPFDDQAMGATSGLRDTVVADAGCSAEVSSGRPSRKPSHKSSKRSRRSLSRKASTAKQKSSEDVEKIEDIPAVPPLPQLSVKKRNVLSEKINSSGRDATADRKLTKSPPIHENTPQYYRQNPMSATSLQADNFTALPIGPPTLRNKRSANETNLPRRKSSKRKADDLAREKEIRAMSPTPIDIPRVPTFRAGNDVFNRDSRTNISGRPQSDASVHLPESLHSSMSVATDQHSFRVSAFDALSPRPTIRYSQNPRFSNASWGPSRTPTRKEKQPAIPEETVKAKKRIDELADELDASTIRELMDRDRRRREQAKKRDEERLQRRLQRKADKQRAEEQREAEEEVNGQGLTSKTVSPVGPSKRESKGTPASWLRDPSKEQLSTPDPFMDPATGVATSKFEEATPISEKDEPVLETAKAVRLSSASMSPPASPVQALQPPPSLGMLNQLASGSTPSIAEQLEPEHRGSDTSGHTSRDWKQIFRRSATRQAKRDSADRAQPAPLAFTNTSRDSLPRQPRAPVQAARLSHPRSGTSMRTQSIFREDLPETPSSPPQSRVQSPDGQRSSESPTLGQVIPERSKRLEDPDSEHRLSDIHPALREEVAMSRHQSVTSPTSSAVLSQSLASVDSEGSWFTGKPVKRSSGPQMNSLRGSAGSLQKQIQDLRSSGEKVDITSDPHVLPEPASKNGRNRNPDDEGLIRKPSYLLSGNTIHDDSDEDSALQPVPVEDAGSTTWHGGSIARHPTIVRQPTAQRARSREGLLNDFTTSAPPERKGQSASIVEKTDSKMTPQEGQLPTPTSESSISPTGDSPIGQVPQRERSFIERATSVDLGKGHVRHISAGSAKLLDLPNKRLSGASSVAGSATSPLPSPRVEKREASS